MHTVRLGVLNKVFDELTKQINLGDFERELNVKRSPYHNNCFEGNECKLIMKNVLKLEQVVKQSKNDLLQFVNVIWMLNLLDESINRKELEQDVTEIIKSFGSEYEEFTKKWSKCDKQSSCYCRTS